MDLELKKYSIDPLVMKTLWIPWIRASRVGAIECPTLDTFLGEEFDPPAVDTYSLF